MGSHSKVGGLPDLTAQKIWVGNPSNRPAEEDRGDMGLSYYGKVTTYTDTTHFKASALAGYGDDFFKGYFVYVVRDAGGAGAAPQYQEKEILDYTSADGTFNHEAFTTPLALGDEVLVLLFSVLLRPLGSGETVLAAANTNLAVSNSSYAKKKEIQVLRGGQIRTQFEMKVSDTAYRIYGKIYVNGSPVGSEHSTNDDTAFLTCEDILSVNKDDLIQVYAYREAAGTHQLRNFKIFATLVPKLAVVIMD